MGGWYLIGGLAAVPVLLWLFVQFVKWVWVPIRLKGKVFSLVRPRWTAATDADLTPEERDVLGRLTAAFARAGFGPPMMHLLTGSIFGADGLEALMTHPATGDIGIVLVARAKQARAFTLGVRADFADGTRLVTGASRNISFFPPNPADDAANFGWVRDVPSLLEAHRRRLDRAGRRGDARVTPDATTIGAYRDRSWDREHAWWVRCGYRYLDASAGKYRATWKGSFLTVWKVTPPVKGWRVGRRERRFRRLWRELGMEAWQPPAAVPIAAIPVPPGPAVDPAGSPLRYEPTLAEGDIRHEQVGDTLTVRCGGPTAGRVLMRQWGKLLSAVFFAGVLCFTCFGLWNLWRISTGLPVNLRWPLLQGVLRRQAMYALLWTAFLVWDVARLIRALRSARGAATITASPAGLQFDNLPGRRRRGHWAREDVHGLSVVLDRVGLSGRRYRLDALPSDPRTRRLTLLRSRSAAPLQDVRRSLLRVMGMTAEPEPVAGVA